MSPLTEIMLYIYAGWAGLVLTAAMKVSAKWALKKLFGDEA